MCVGGILGFNRERMAILMSLSESGFRNEAIKIRKSLGSYGVSFPPDCPSELSEMKKQLKSWIEFFKKRAEIDRAVLEKLKKKFT